MGSENLMCPICGGLHPAGHRDKELEDKLEAIKTHMESAPDRVPRDNWLRPTKSFLLQVLDWIIAHRKILEAEA